MSNKIVVSIAPSSQDQFDLLYPQAKAAADFVEIRLDNSFWPTCSFQDEPVLLTGGDLFQRAALQPAMIDVPYELRALSAELKSTYPDMILLGSYHDFEGSSAVVDRIQELDRASVDCIKIACRCKTATEALTLLTHLRNPPTHKPLTIVPMGEKVSFGRVVAAALGSHLTFTCLEGLETAAGQIPVHEMQKRYRAGVINHLYGLIGSPVTHSISHIIHNKVLEQLNIPAAYVKIDMSLDEMDRALPLLQECGFKGLSVTMPLKEHFGEPVNTLQFDKTMSLNNTDGRAVAELFSKHLDLKNSTILVLGAGGTAKAIVEALTLKGVKVIISNRTAEKADILARKFDAKTHPYGLPIPKVDGIVQATSLKNVHLEGIEPHHVILDVGFPQETQFLKSCHTQGVTTISGLDMWVRQAACQFKIWLNIDVESIITHHVYETGK